MSVVYCHECDKMIDTDLDVEHFQEQIKAEAKAYAKRVDDEVFKRLTA